ncbi:MULTISPECIES: hypothetical protein [unclassified Bradyrhizobium]|uniref:hypothetical protein n=1 Tax=unclassified Bradyrhizobium TaxID=2631580 RepID=UPI001FFC13F6|nr:MULTISPECIES: hypothetical protein [unclassified Bradyrhizobium]MCK1343107.1 hypothetical protein [Bradyrhizobium sp. CW11]MCK1586461.1 hypothetical protein [Bradyrhizobium sp. 169]
MGYFDELRKGSKSHRVRVISERAFRIEPIDDTRDALRNFQDIAEDAIANEDSEYQVKPHPQHRIDLPNWKGPVYDMVAITRDET